MRKTDYTPAYGMQGPKERKLFLARKEKLSTYRTTIHQFLPFVFIRCTKYTNSKCLAEIVAIYTFICAYRLAEILDGVNKIVILIDNMVGITGEDYSHRKGICVNGKLLFKWEDDLRFARQLAEMRIEECLDKIKRHPDLIARNIDLDQFERITVSVMENLVEENVLQRLNRSNI